MVSKKVSVSVSKKIGIEKSIGFGIEKNWYRKKVSDSVSFRFWVSSHTDTCIIQASYVYKLLSRIHQHGANGKVKHSFENSKSKSSRRSVGYMTGQHWPWLRIEGGSLTEHGERVKVRNDY